MERSDFINQLENLTGWEVSKIEWIYGVNGYMNPCLDEVYYCDVSLQVYLEDPQGDKYWVSLEGDSICGSRVYILGSLIDSFIEGGFNYNDLPTRVDIDKLVNLMREYFLTYAEVKEKPFLDLVYYETY